MAGIRDSFSLRVKEDFGGVAMRQYMDQLADRMKRGVIRKMVAAAGQTLVKEVRVQLNSRDMPYSRARDVDARRRSRSRGVKPLSLTIKKKAWSKRDKGLIGSVVGPAFPAGAHGHLVEFGHRITGQRKDKSKSFRSDRKTIRRSGDRTVAHKFQTEAAEKSTEKVYREMHVAMKKFIAKQGTAKVK